VDATAALQSAPVFVLGGHVVPSRIPAWAELPDGTTVTLDIEVTVESARAIEVAVKNERGIGWTRLATVQVRDLVATAILIVLQRATVKPNGDIALALPVGKQEEAAAWDVMRTLVGYKPNTVGLDRVAS
jgi:hypothetical protein